MAGMDCSDLSVDISSDISDGIDNWGSDISIEDYQFPNLLSEAYTSSHSRRNASGTTETLSRSSQGRVNSTLLAPGASDSDSDERLWNNLARPYSSGSSDTSGDEFSNLDISDVSDDSSIADDDDDYGVFEMLDHHFNIVNNFVPSFFGVSLQMLYARILESITSEEERESPTPKDILDSLPSMKVNSEQVAMNISCCICFCEYALNEDLLQLPCSHIYHKSCILDWLKIKCTCPTCRLDLTASSTNDSNEEGEMIDWDLPYSPTEDMLYRINIRDSNRDLFSTRDSIAENSYLDDSASDDPDSLPSLLPDINGITHNSNVTTTLTSDPRTILPNVQNVRASSNRLNSLVSGRNSNGVELLHNDEPGELMQRNTAKETKRFSRETEIW